MFDTYSTDIIQDTILADAPKEKVIQVCDLCRFIAAYRQPLRILDYEQKINIIQYSSMRVGIYFYDLAYNASNSQENWFCCRKKTEELRRHLRLDALWLVVVVENAYSDKRDDADAFIKKSNASGLYDAIFYFNFSQSIIKTLYKKKYENN